eukprot:COSAG06_NODE_7158_length_2604_cov_0.969661_1_plen_849_part_10
MSGKEYEQVAKEESVEVSTEAGEEQAGEEGGCCGAVRGGGANALFLLHGRCSCVCAPTCSSYRSDGSAPMAVLLCLCAPVAPFCSSLFNASYLQLVEVFLGGGVYVSCSQLFTLLCCSATPRRAQLCKKDEVPHDVDPERHNHCRDTLCILIFGAFWAFLVAMFAFVWAYGDLNRLVYPSDYNDFLCGMNTGDVSSDGAALASLGNLEARTYATFPRLADDVASVMQGSTCDDVSECTIELFSVCTETCPKQGDIVCTYQIEETNPSEAERRDLAQAGSTGSSSGCWFTPIDTVAYFGRCIPWPEKLATETYTCKDASDDSVELYKGPEMCYSPASLHSSSADGGSWVDDDDDDVCKAVMDHNAWKTNAGCVPDDESHPLRGHTVLRNPCRVPDNRDLCLGTSGCAYVGPFGTPPPGRRDSDCSGVVYRVQQSNEMTTGGSDILMAMLVSYTTVAQQIFEDVISTSSLVLLCGSLVSILLGFGFLLLLYIFAPCIVWGLVIAVFGAIGLADAYVSLKAGEFLIWDISNLTSTIQSEAEIISANTDPGQNLDVDEWAAVSDPDNIVYWRIASYVLTIVWVMYACLMICGVEKIQLCIKVIKSASDMIGTVPGVILVPVFIYSLQLCFMVFFAFYIMMLKSVDSFTVSDLAAAAEATCQGTCDTTDSSCLTNCVQEATAGHETGIVAEATPEAAADAAEEDNLAFYMMWVAFFGFLWTANMFAGIGTIVMSRSVADNYWHDPEDTHPLPTMPTVNALKGTLFYHLGSAIFGGLLIAIIQLIRAIIEYIDRQTKALREHNPSLECVFKVLACCSWCAEKVVKYLTSNAYICVAITGKAFMPSAWQAFKILLK